MPYSGIVFDDHVKKFISKYKFINYLDIGCGAGKYGKLIKQLNPSSFINGIEISKKYITQFKLKKIYDKIYNDDVNNFCRKNMSFTTNLVIIGDCIEHLWKSDGLNLINFLVYRSKFILIIFPSELVQFADNGEESENHISIWSKHDFTNFKHQYFKKGCMNLVIIKGYL